jgi:dihydroorotate dehydrogenase
MQSEFPERRTQSAARRSKACEALVVESLNNRGTADRQLGRILSKVHDRDGVVVNIASPNDPMSRSNLQVHPLHSQIVSLARAKDQSMSTERNRLPIVIDRTVFNSQA